MISDRVELSRAGRTMPDGSFPVRDVEDLALGLVASARVSDSDRFAVLTHLGRSSRDLGLTAATFRRMAARVPEIGDAVEALWDEARHPRGRDGKWIEVGGRVRVYNGPKRIGSGRVVSFDDSGVLVKIRGAVETFRSSQLEVLAAKASIAPPSPASPSTEMYVREVDWAKTKRVNWGGLTYDVVEVLHGDYGAIRGVRIRESGHPTHRVLTLWAEDRVSPGNAWYDDVAFDPGDIAAIREAVAAAAPAVEDVRKAAYSWDAASLTDTGDLSGPSQKVWRGYEAMRSAGASVDSAVERMLNEQYGPETRVLHDIGSNKAELGSDKLSRQMDTLREYYARAAGLIGPDESILDRRMAMMAEDGWDWSGIRAWDQRVKDALPAPIQEWYDDQISGIRDQMLETNKLRRERVVARRALTRRLLEEAGVSFGVGKSPAAAVKRQYRPVGFSETEKELLFTQIKSGLSLMPTHLIERIWSDRSRFSVTRKGRPARSSTTLYAHPRIDASTVLHEEHHGLEFVSPLVRTMAWAALSDAITTTDGSGQRKWRKGSRLGKKAGDRYRLTGLKTLSGGSDYAPDEVAFEDEFADPYVGKVYDQGAIYTWGRPQAAHRTIPPWQNGQTNYEILTMTAEAVFGDRSDIPSVEIGGDHAIGVLERSRTLREWYIGMVLTTQAVGA